MLNNTKGDLPLKPLSEVVDFNPRIDKSAYRDDLEVSFVPMAAVDAGSGRIEVSQTKHFSKVKKGYTPFQENDVLFAKITPCMENGKMAVVPKLINGLGFGSTEFHVLRPHEGIDSRYIYYFVSSQSFRREAAHRMTGAVGQKRVPLPFLEETLIPVPLFDDQKRIVAEIEKQFSRLDEAVANLKRIKANLKRFKAAVLKAAVEGKLTENWRKKNPDVEPAYKLLERILAERRSKWIGRGKYKEAVAPDTTNLPELPEGWTWASLEQASVKITDGTHHSPKNFPHGEYKYITSKNVREFRLDLKDLTYVDKDVHDEIYSRCDVKKYDVLYVKDGVNTGLAATNTLDEPFSLLSSVGVFRTVDQLMPDFLVIYLNSNEVRDRMLANIAGVAITRLTLNKLKATLIAIPPPTEQAQIVLEVQRRLSIIERLGSSIDANLNRNDRLRQSILEKAFSGRLVPEKPNTESASLLLTRIHTAKVTGIDKTKLPQQLSRILEKGAIMPNLIEALRSAGDWITAQDAFRLCGISDGADTDCVEQMYEELRESIHLGQIVVERRGDQDWLCLAINKGG